MEKCQVWLPLIKSSVKLSFVKLFLTNIFDSEHYQKITEPFTLLGGKLYRDELSASDHDNSHELLNLQHHQKVKILLKSSCLSKFGSDPFPITFKIVSIKGYTF